MYDVFPASAGKANSLHRLSKLYKTFFLFLSRYVMLFTGYAGSLTDPQKETLRLKTKVVIATGLTSYLSEQRS